MNAPQFWGTYEVGGNFEKKCASRQNRPPNQIFTQGNFLENKESK